MSICSLAGVMAVSTRAVGLEAADDDDRPWSLFSVVVPGFTFTPTMSLFLVPVVSIVCLSVPELFLFILSNCLTTCLPACHVYTHTCSQTHLCHQVCVVPSRRWVGLLTLGQGCPCSRQSQSPASCSRSSTMRLVAQSETAEDTPLQ